MDFETKRISSAPDTIAPDGSEVRVLCDLTRGSLALFSLPPKAISKAVAHRTVEEIWYFISGYGRMWRLLGDNDEISMLVREFRSPFPPGPTSSSDATVSSPSRQSVRRCRHGLERTRPMNRAGFPGGSKS